MLGIWYCGIWYGIAKFYVGLSKQYDQTRLNFFYPFCISLNYVDYQSLHEFIKILQKPSFF